MAGSTEDTTNMLLLHLKDTEVHGSNSYLAFAPSILNTQGIKAYSTHGLRNQKQPISTALAKRRGHAKSRHMSAPIQSWLRKYVLAESSLYQACSLAISV